MRLGPYRHRERCALCWSVRLDEVLSLDYTPLANEFVTKSEMEFAAGGQPERQQQVFPLGLVMCQVCKHVQIQDIVDARRLFKNYVYATGTSAVTVEHFRKQAETLVKDLRLVPSSFIVEIGSNDGTLLSEFKKLGCKRVLGIDPAKDIASSAVSRGIPTIIDFFTPVLAEHIVEEHEHASVVIANNVFAHAEDVRSIAIGVRELIGRRGHFVFEVSYLMDIAEHLTFDTIYHEHFSYHALKPLVSMFEELGLKVYDAVRIPGQMGRGSLRVSVAHESKKLPVDMMVTTSIEVEERSGILSSGFYKDIKGRITAAGVYLSNFLNEELAQGKTIVGYGAPAKLTTLMYAFGLNKRHAQFIVDDSPLKQGMFTPGLHIPVVTPSALDLIPPGSIVVVYAWNFADDIIKRFAGMDLVWVVPVPLFRKIEGGKS